MRALTFALLLYSRTPSLLSLFSLFFTHSCYLDSTEAEDMEVDGGAAVVAADGITDAVLVAGT